MLGQLSKGRLSKEDYCPRDFCPRRLLSKETFVQGDYCPSTNEYLTDSGVSIEKKHEVSLDIKCPRTILDKSLLGQMSPWTIDS